ncbi:hypothetical protein CLPUN_42960 [Clostridium puniceum]|uniref:Uncharacterized protein n=1 Tax=Clostridium puniceum TaxID=29367 RepID=A0A1S8T8E2_9CLOT|nr:hypothetical protein [Clostridium puniceum]OOM73861.1 hypothetical protein CLPUN_42960 [Clostridium puniceum]
MDKLGICGWLSREGNFYECGESKHNLLAAKLEEDLDLKMYSEERAIYLHDTALLEALGFVKFTQSKYGSIEESIHNQYLLFFGTRFSYPQRKWMELNISKMLPEQKIECRKRLMLGY